MFEKNFLISPNRQKRVKLAQTLTQHITNMAEKAPPINSISIKRSWWQSLLAIFPKSPVYQLIAIAAILLLITGSGWLFIETMRLRNEIAKLKIEQADRAKTIEQNSQISQQIANERARADQLIRELEQERKLREQQEKLLTKPPSSNSSSTPPVNTITFTLMPVSVRDTDDDNELAISTTAQMVQLKLNINEVVDYQKFRVRINSENENGTEIWQQTSLKPSRVGKDSLLVINIPAQLLTNGDYLIELSGAMPNQESEVIDNYIFTIKKNVTSPKTKPAGK